MTYKTKLSCWLVVLVVLFASTTTFVFAGGGGGGGGGGGSSSGGGWGHQRSTFDGPGGTDSNSVQNGARSTGTVRSGGQTRESFSNPDGTTATRSVDTGSGGSNGGGSRWNINRNTTPPPPPPPVLAEINDFTILVNGVRHSNPVIVPEDIVQIRWSSNGNFCEGLGDAVNVSGPSGTVTQSNNGFLLGETRTYGVRCRRSASGALSQWVSRTARVRMSNVDLGFAVNPTIIRAGNTTEFTWSIERDEAPSDGTNANSVTSMECSILGGFPIGDNPFDPADYRVGAGLAENSVRSLSIANFTQSTLRCNEPITGTTLETMTTIEVIPGIQEI